MNRPLFSIFDAVAGFYSPVFVAENDNHAIRMFNQSIDMDHKVDFNLWQLGAFDNDTGEITDTTPRLVLAGQSLETKDKS